MMSEMTNLSGLGLEAKNYWPHFEAAGALNTWVIDSDGDVGEARSQGTCAGIQAQFSNMRRNSTSNTSRA